MSRIGNQPILIPEGVKVEIKPNFLFISGEKGELTVNVPTSLTTKETDGKLLISRSSEEKNIRALHGTIRALAANAVQGVNQGWSKILELHGSGYRVVVVDNNLELQVGFSHPVLLVIPKGLEAKIIKNKITVTGCDKYLVGEFAAKIRAVRKPEPYKGKGIKYADEYILRKVGKALKSTE